MLSSLFSWPPKKFIRCPDERYSGLKKRGDIDTGTDRGAMSKTIMSPVDGAEMVLDFTSNLSEK